MDFHPRPTDPTLPFVLQIRLDATVGLARCSAIHTLSSGGLVRHERLKGTIPVRPVRYGRASGSLWSRTSFLPAVPGVIPSVIQFPSIRSDNMGWCLSKALNFTRRGGSILNCGVWIQTSGDEMTSTIGAFFRRGSNIFHVIGLRVSSWGKRLRPLITASSLLVCGTNPCGASQTS